MVEEICDTEDKRNLVHEGEGHAVIYGPDGSPLAEKLPETSEGIVYATIDLAAIAVAKNAADPAGHYSRPSERRTLGCFSLPYDGVNKREGGGGNQMSRPPATTYDPLL
jgi:hypothetical protein